MEGSGRAGFPILSRLPGPLSHGHLGVPCVQNRAQRFCPNLALLLTSPPHRGSAWKPQRHPCVCRWDSARSPKAPTAPLALPHLPSCRSSVSARPDADSMTPLHRRVSTTITPTHTAPALVQLLMLSPRTPGAASGPGQGPNPRPSPNTAPWSPPRALLPILPQV